MAGEANEVLQLAADLGRVPAGAGPKIVQAIEVTARNIKDDANANFTSLAGDRLQHTPGTVDYEMGKGARATSFTRTPSIEAEVGPNLGRRQGPFAGWFEDGAVDGIPDANPMEDAMKANTADFEKGLGIAIADALREAIS